MEFSRQEYWSGLPFSSPGDLPNPGIKLGCSSFLRDTLPFEPPGYSLFLLRYSLFFCLIKVSLYVTCLKHPDFSDFLVYTGASQVALVVRNLPVNVKDIRD